MPPDHLPEASEDGAPASEASFSGRPVRLLTFSTLYPNAAMPSHGVFVENRLRHLVTGGEVGATVLAPVPWFPFAHPRFGAWARHAAAPGAEQRYGLTVLHPRYIALPRIGLHTNPYTLYRASRRAIAAWLGRGGEFDLLDAHYLYPDGVAATWLAQEFGVPVVITARGSDTSLLPRYRRPRRLIQEAIRRADALIAVSAALKDGLVELGAPPGKVTVLRNGVDTATFRPPADRATERAALGFPDGPVIISVGLLIERKRHHLTIEALRDLPGHTLLVLGEGPLRGELETLAARLGVADRVRLLGGKPHEELRRYYGAADVMVLASSREGWANVLLESMACGTPVVASPAWGSREAVSAPEAGIVLDETTPASIAAGVRALLAEPPSRAATRAHAERHGWGPTTQGQLDLFRRLLRRT
ncbi:glycosyltransferase [Roseomonas sp. CCTCC AB2023176]|uniref:glycosyltransferase n=1 Tax=Roseomonas sp. CCTCC AB2023176 TaxID=3342640 RepID=UPI0035D88DFC